MNPGIDGYNFKTSFPNSITGSTNQSIDDLQRNQKNFSAVKPVLKPNFLPSVDENKFDNLSYESSPRQN